ncbi:hypothetical protein B0T11DRAFT_86111 [Plectosphaerella cucumerina]|uniref:Uncharacterized protein n=1 Tax=Plectosphaerella cucumerina TaxID=40658 RepID=A0A8K0TH63_9PEZI|nr:hypothetical protein B0T11DRAFT_86111 [Plectosphaerella cucumerina]
MTMPIQLPSSPVFLDSALLGKEPTSDGGGRRRLKGGVRGGGQGRVSRMCIDHDGQAEKMRQAVWKKRWIGAMVKPRRVRRHRCSHLNHMRGASVVPSLSSVVIALRAGSRTAWAGRSNPSKRHREGTGKPRMGWQALPFLPHVTTDSSITFSHLIFLSIVPRLGAPNVSKKEEKSNEKRTGVPLHRIPRKPESRNPIVSPRSPLLTAAAGPSVPSDRPFMPRLPTIPLSLSLDGDDYSTLVGWGPFALGPLGP